jgi:transmembrane sensor
MRVVPGSTRGRIGPLALLKQGEAFFEVAKDPNRPFVVSAGSKRVVAVGTKFSVRRDADSVGVVVTEGKVRVDDVDTDGPIFLTPGAIAFADDAGVRVQRTAPPATQPVALAVTTNPRSFG